MNSRGRVRNRHRLCRAVAGLGSELWSRITLKDIVTQWVIRGMKGTLAGCNMLNGDGTLRPISSFLRRIFHPRDHRGLLQVHTRPIFGLQDGDMILLKPGGAWLLRLPFHFQWVPLCMHSRTFWQAPVYAYLSQNLPSLIISKVRGHTSLGIERRVYTEIDRKYGFTRIKSKVVGTIIGRIAEGSRETREEGVMEHSVKFTR
jgi:hypothetical protein